ncbi:hypothetical protein L873DRAFT_1847147 [Choiromyces venosus 120613-1]|uniref:Uncharacterized protein n=1 Tax=Choiromyces venosus 120613-1 TaxID=1336337 RepID=A0A3N4J5D0_9PEZI|nr:hypothetical protein L873DRAFT_1847147 [Choiromyces venosus 120613-1]
MSATGCVTGYNWYVCSSPDLEYRGCCAVDACVTGCGVGDRQENTRQSPPPPRPTPSTSTTTAGSGSTRSITITSTIRVSSKSSSTSSSEGDTSQTLFSLSSTSTAVSVIISKISPSTSIPASEVSETLPGVGETTTSIIKEKVLNKPAIIGGAVGGFVGFAALILFGIWIFRRRHSRKKTIKETSYTPKYSPSLIAQITPFIPWFNKKPKTATLVTTGHSARALSPQTSLDPPVEQLRIVQAPAPPAPPAIPAPIQPPMPPPPPSSLVELPTDWEPPQRQSIYDQATLSLTIQREANSLPPPRPAFTPLGGSSDLRRNPYRRAMPGSRSFIETRGHPLQDMSQNMGYRNNNPGYRASAPEATFPSLGGRGRGSGGAGGDVENHLQGRENLSHIRHLSWQDWEEQGVYMTHGPPFVPVAPPIMGEGSEAGAAGQYGQYGQRVSDAGGGGGGGFQYRRPVWQPEELQPEDPEEDARRAAAHQPPPPSDEGYRY